MRMFMLFTSLALAGTLGTSGCQPHDPSAEEVPERSMASLTPAEPGPGGASTDYTMSGADSSVPGAEPGARPGGSGYGDGTGTTASSESGYGSGTSGDGWSDSTAATESGYVEHVVKRNDTLWSLAKRYLGDGKRWREIVEANPGIQPDRLHIGKTLKIPTR